MGKIALITDIHANLEALEAVLDDIQKHDVSDIVSLGDNVGYGPNPFEVLQILDKLQIFSLEGNHDLAVINPASFNEANPTAINALKWTRTQLKKSVKKDKQGRKIYSSYFGTPSFCVLPDEPRVVLVHGSPGSEYSRFDYLLKPEDLLMPAMYMQEQGWKICFFGHTHYQVLWEIDEAGVSYIDYQIDDPIEFTESEIEDITLLINPGSVGQPRDEDPNAAYLIYEKKPNSHVFTFKRIPYKIKKTVKKIYEISSLDDRLGDRLLIGR